MCAAFGAEYHAHLLMHKITISTAQVDSIQPHKSP